ncbi:MAG: DUF5765 domain-containing protein [Pseudomonadota bacterium]
MAAVGIGSTVYAMIRREPIEITSCLGFFSLMEMLQAVTYLYVDQCGTPMNQVLTMLGYIHISMQPFFINTISMFFIPAHVRKRIAPTVYTICFASTVIMLLMIYPFDGVPLCNRMDSAMCGATMCSYMGSFHIAWDFPMNTLFTIGNGAQIYELAYLLNWWMYLIPAFVLPVLYGSWKCTLYHLFFGPLLATAITGNFHEMPAVWCLLSIGLLLIVVKTPVRDLLFVDRWFWWERRPDEPHYGVRRRGPAGIPAE